MENEQVNQQPAPDQEQGADKLGELTKMAQEAIYMDQKVFGSLIKMLQAEGQDASKAIGMATVGIVDKLEETVGEIDTDTLQRIGQVVVGELLELAEKAGVIESPGKDEYQDSLGEAFGAWMKAHPERVNKDEIMAAMQSAGGQQMMQRKGIAMPGAQSAEQAQPATPQGGLLDEAV